MSSHPTPSPILERTDAAPLIALRDARVSTARGAVLLDVPALDLFPGDRVVITGQSGSGKSMLLSTLMGHWAVGLHFDGDRMTAPGPIGVVPQRGLDALHPLVPLGRQLARVSGTGRVRVEKTLAQVGLPDPDLRRRRPAEISGGQAQRAAVALAALTDAPLILADEPTSALDHDTRDLMLALLGEVIGPEQVLVVATHDTTVVRVLGTRHLRVSEGRVTELPVEHGRAA
ncbi:MAG: ATP-binding cassette domain-containing protein [Tessaracoccus sp.]|uniref:ATP-binding cassette domain-containing protein n=1 Tax=Tessaracoccus sp. TaxID=1971211 RepID=UPI001ECCF9E6|nr:ATP-binding cassette domain-containing protein [Tessaracoccus sp.]MBK7819708.1 ATP-binding cassette domain-containing protein [Tessaracoccus sp.]